MTDAPERTWVTWPNLNGTGLAFSCQARPPAKRTEYVRADLCDPLADPRVQALVKAAQAVADNDDAMVQLFVFERDALVAALAALKGGK
jgi:hypothetical protein